jgi:hypothetical protein
MGSLADSVREFFTGFQIERGIIENPFVEGGPFLLVKRYFSSEGIYFGESYSLATPTQIRRFSS